MTATDDIPRTTARLAFGSCAPGFLRAMIQLDRAATGCRCAPTAAFPDSCSTRCGSAAKGLQPQMAPSHFEFFPISGGNLPLDWDEARRRVAIVEKQ